MTRANESVATIARHATTFDHGDGTGSKIAGCVSNGITLREHFAGLAMQGLAATDLYYGTQGKPESPWPWVAEQAVKAADALLAALAKEQS